MAHAIRVMADPSIAPDAKETFETGIEDAPFVSVLPEQHTLPTLLGSESLDQPEHVYGMARWDDAEPRDSILMMLTDGLLRDADWYVVETHDCTHDRDGGPCDGWTEAERDGDVPL